MGLFVVLSANTRRHSSVRLRLRVAQLDPDNIPYSKHHRSHHQPNRRQLGQAPRTLPSHYHPPL
jgi:hypothetical protein